MGWEIPGADKIASKERGVTSQVGMIGKREGRGENLFFSLLSRYRQCISGNKSE